MFMHNGNVSTMKVQTPNYISENNVIDKMICR